jgi:hypothetical protein
MATRKQRKTVVAESREVLHEAKLAAKDAVKKAKAALVLAEAELDLATHRHLLAGAGVGSDTEAQTRRILEAKEAAVAAAQTAV